MQETTDDFVLRQKTTDDFALQILKKDTFSGGDIDKILNLIDIQSANIVYKRCAEEFQFKTFEIEEEIFSIARELAPVFGYASKTDVSHVLERHDIRSNRYTTFVEYKQKLKKVFGLHRNDGTTRLINYRGFLTIALEGKGQNCSKVRDYLLEMEKKARVDTIVQDNIGMSASQLQEVGEDIDDPIIQSAMQTAKMSQDIIFLRKQQLATNERINHLEANFEMEKVINSEQEHTLNMLREQFVKLKTINGTDSRKAYQEFYNKIKHKFHIGIWRGMGQRQFPLAVEWIETMIDYEEAKLKQASFL